ncbi:MAG: hypothetical protein IPP47_05530 [Bryobacterales bacterium]|nr:hypothetical protein [Bryobacterales bacterium]
MFEFLFNYPLTVFQKGTLVFASGWPLWLLGALVLAAAALVAWLFLRKPLPRARALVLGGLQWAAIALLLLMLFQPAVSVSQLKPQQNVVAVLVDTSRSMALEERLGKAVGLLNSGLLEQLKKRFPVRLYSAARDLSRLESLPAMATQPVTNLGDSLQGATGEAATLPIGAIVLLSDGADNAGGLDTNTMAALRRSRIPIHTIGFGREQMDRDLEITDAQIPVRSLPDARLSATVTLRQAGYAGKPVRLMVQDGSKTLATREIRLPDDGQSSREVISFQSGPAGAKALRVSLAVLDGETNDKNNAVTRLVNVEDRKPRILYFEGEPRWEMKFIRRAAELDANLELVSIVRTTQNKFYRQGVTDPKELEHGFPDSIEELFRYQGIIIGNVEAGYFNAQQQSLLKEFADRRGGGVLFLGGRATLSDGGWNHSPAADMLPVLLPDRKGTFHREPAAVELTVAGRDSLVTRVEESPDKNMAKWKSLPMIADYQETGAAKPGALVLAELRPTSGGRFPLLATQNFGRGRVALFATGGSWRWQMGQDSKDMSHEVFWQQLLRWMVSDVSGRVAAVTSRQVYEDDARIVLQAGVRDMNYLPSAEATVEAHILGPGGAAAVVPLRPVTGVPGAYTGEWRAEAPGAYLTEIVAKQGETELGRDVLNFRREDGVAENFRTEQNRELLERIAQQTGGRYYKPEDAGRLPQEIEYSDAGISVKETHGIWNAPAAFLLLAGLKAAEWLLRRKWGAV